MTPRWNKIRGSGVEKLPLFDCVAGGLLEARSMRVMQLLRQDVALSAARAWGGC